MNKFGINVKKVRELQGISRKYMAKRMNLSLTAYGNIERGKTQLISIEKKRIIADILGLEYEKLRLLETVDVNYNYHISVDDNVYLAEGNNSEMNQIVGMISNLKQEVCCLNNTLSVLIQALAN